MMQSSPELAESYLKSLYDLYAGCVEAERFVVASLPGRSKRDAEVQFPLLAWERFEAMMVDASRKPRDWSNRIHCLRKIVGRWGHELPVAIKYS